jgi:hypothetical protein
VSKATYYSTRRSRERPTCEVSTVDNLGAAVTLGGMELMSSRHKFIDRPGE